MPLTHTRGRFSKISVYFLSIRISLRNFVGVNINADYMKKVKERNEEDYPEEKYISSYHLREDETHELFNRTLNFTFIEMARFLKSEEECTTVLDKLTYSLKHMHELDAPPAFFNEEFFKVLYNLSELNNFTAKEIRNYMRSLYAESDYANTIEYAEKVGEARGIAIGIAKREAQIVTAMLEKGMDIEMICEITGLTPDEVNARM